MNNIVTARKKWPVVALVFIVALAAGFRLYHLGVSSFRADTMLFFDICHRPVSGWVVFTQWMELMGRTAQFPFSLAITKLFIDVFHLAPTAFIIRLPNAVFGILMVWCMYLLGRQMAGRVFGLALALWLAVNPFHIQLSREAYFYSAMLLGVTLQAWACLWAFRHRNRRTPFPISFHLLTQVGFFLMTYSHVSGWWVGALFVPFLGWILGRRAWREPQARPDFWWWLIVTVLLGLPLLFMAWGLPYFLKDQLSPETKEQVKRVHGQVKTPMASFVWQLVKSASWGATPWRAVFLVVTGVLTIMGLLFNRMRYRRAWIVFLFILGGFCVYYLSLIATGSFAYSRRHVAFLMPLYIAMLAYGVWHVSAIPFVRRMIKSPVWRRAPAYGITAIAVALSLQPAWFCTQLTGKPAPFKEIAQWCDSHLPPRTLVLVERWFDPWNELRVHNSTNVYFTFTVPSEPEDLFKQFNWPATAKVFFEKFPDAAYLEYCNSERARMGVLTNWHFARQVVFTNLAGIKLAKLGLAYRDDFYDPATNRIISTIFYNTRDDVIQHAREQGRSTLVLYAPSWGYVKLWQQLKDFRDWRILEDKATLDVYNLTPQTNIVTLLIRGMAANGAKRVRFGMFSQADFQNLQLVEWRIERVPLKPGLNQFVLTDALWSLAKIPLLVDQVEAVEADIRGQRSEVSRR
ncbi:MAG: hypothetical protein KKE37_02725 [Verrucomicrobia bacterium]|nr:hypothetical protein [Verrucomicrobiota bacterium]MBU4428250.1 hypothetical protein [Verrucomicrobiota bacterium]MCG2679549.1 hypothetical protein [Kiritimatiellia bacterium]